jgi:Cu-Zn family superoxide dismutase
MKSGRTTGSIFGRGRSAKSRRVTYRLRRITGFAIAQQLTVDINRISDQGVGDKIGTVVVSEGKGGVSFKVAVSGLAKGQRGFHVHEKGDCGPAVKDGR